MLGWCVETTVIAAGLAALALVAGRRGRQTPEARHALWLVVVAKFLIPPVVAWPWALGDRPFVVASAVRAETEALPAILAGPLPAAGEPPLPAAAPEVVSFELPPPFAPSVDPESPPAAVDRGLLPPEPVPIPVGPAAGLPDPWRFDARSLLLAGWLVGSVVVAARGGIRIARFRRTLRLGDPAPAWLRDEVAGVGRRLGMTRLPAVLVVAGLPTPLLWCLGRPRLVVPEGLNRLTPDARAGLLAHELAHLARRDHWVVRVELLAGLAWWWNPVFRLAVRRIRDEAEAACDARVVRTFPHDRVAYAEALIQVCERHARAVPPLPALGIGGSSAARTLEARLLMILRDPICPPSRWLFPTTLALLALALPAWTLGGQDPAPPADPSRPVAPTSRPDDPVAPAAAPPTQPDSGPPVAAPAVRADEPAPPRAGGNSTGPPLVQSPAAPAAASGSDSSFHFEIHFGSPQAKPAAPAPAAAPASPAANRGLHFKASIAPGVIQQMIRGFKASEVATAEAVRDRLRAEANRAADLASRNGISRRDAEQAGADLQLAEADVTLHRAELAVIDSLVPDAEPGGIDPANAAFLRAYRANLAASIAKAELQVQLATAANRDPAALTAARAALDREKAQQAGFEAWATQGNPTLPFAGAGFPPAAAIAPATPSLPAPPRAEPADADPRGEEIRRQVDRDPRMVELVKQMNTLNDRAEEIRRNTRESGDPAERNARKKAALIKTEYDALRQQLITEITNRPTSNPPGSPISLAQARRDAQAAEVERVEAQRDQAAIESKNTEKLFQNKTVSKNESDLYQSKLRAAEATVAREKARLAEADALIRQPNPAPSQSLNYAPGELPILQARRAIQAAEVDRAEAQRDRTRADIQRSDALLQRNAIGRQEYDEIRATSRIAEAELAREKARLAEADALLNQAKTPRAVDADVAPASTRPAMILSDYRELAELAEVSLQVKRAELQKAQTKVARAKTLVDAKEPLAKEGRVTQGEWFGVKNDYDTAQDDARIKEIEVREAELRLKQAKRRADTEEARVKRLAERTRVELDRARDLYRRKIVGVQPLNDVRGRYDELMFQLDPNYQPEPEQPADPAQPK